MSFTFAQLKQVVQDYTENDEETFVDNLDFFIKNTEDRILKNIQLNLFRKNATGTLTTGNEYLALPADFLAPFSLSFTNSDDDKVFVEMKDVNFVQTFSPDDSVVGEPRYYAQFDHRYLILGPTPDDDYEVELHYFYRPASLTEGEESDMSWLSKNAPNAMLYGTLVEAYTFMKGEEKLMAVYENRFQDALRSMKIHGEAREVRDNFRYGGIIREKQ